MNSYISDALYRKLREIAFLSLWDECLIIAQDLSVERKIPKSIKLDISIFDDEKEFLSRSENKEFWEELQAYVCKQVCTSIEKGEINTLYVGRTIEGEIKPEDTFVHRDELDKWMEIRDLERGEPSFHFEEETQKFFHEMEYAVDNYAECIVEYLYEPYHEWKKPDRDKEQLKFQNKHLKKQIDDLEKLQKSRKPITKHQDRHAVNREQVLGAAMSVIAKYPSQSKNKQGKIEATKVRILIEEKALLFWQKDGEPPLKSESIEKLIREWLNKTA